MDWQYLISCDQIEDLVDNLLPLVFRHPLKHDLKHPLTQLSFYLQNFKSATHEAAFYASDARRTLDPKSIDIAFHILTSGLLDALVTLEAVLQRNVQPKGTSREIDTLYEDYPDEQADNADLSREGDDEESNEHIKQLISILLHYASVIHYLKETIAQRRELDASFQSKLSSIRTSLISIHDNFFQARQPAVPDANSTGSSSQRVDESKVADLLFKYLETVQSKALRNYTDSHSRYAWKICHSIYWLEIAHSRLLQQTRSQRPSITSSTSNNSSNNFSLDVEAVVALIKSTWLIADIDKLDEYKALPNEIHDLVSFLCCKLVEDFQRLYAEMVIEIDYTDLLEEFSTVFRLSLPWEGKPDSHHDTSPSAETPTFSFNYSDSPQNDSSGRVKGISSSSGAKKFPEDPTRTVNLSSSDDLPTKSPGMLTSQVGALLKSNETPYSPVDSSTEGGAMLLTPNRTLSILSSTTQSTGGGVPLAMPSRTSSQPLGVNAGPTITSAASLKTIDPSAYLQELTSSQPKIGSLRDSKRVPLPIQLPEQSQHTSSVPPKSPIEASEKYYALEQFPIPISTFGIPPPSSGRKSGVVPRSKTESGPSLISPISSMMLSSNPDSAFTSQFSNVDALSNNQIFTTPFSTDMASYEGKGKGKERQRKKEPLPVVRSNARSAVGRKLARHLATSGSWKLRQKPESQESKATGTHQRARDSTSSSGTSGLLNVVTSISDSSSTQSHSSLNAARTTSTNSNHLDPIIDQEPTVLGLLVTELENAEPSNGPHVRSKPKPNEVEIGNTEYEQHWFSCLETNFLQDNPFPQWTNSRVKIFKTFAGFFNGVNFRLWIERDNKRPVEVQFGILGTELVPSYVFNDISLTSNRDPCHIYLRSTGVKTSVQYNFDRSNPEETQLYGFQGALLSSYFEGDYPVQGVIFFRAQKSEQEFASNTIFQIWTETDLVHQSWISKTVPDLASVQALPTSLGRRHSTLDLDQREVPAVKMFFFIEGSIYVLFISDRIMLQRGSPKKRWKPDASQKSTITIVPRTKDHVKYLRVGKLKGFPDQPPGIPLDHKGIRFEDQNRDDLFHNYDCVKIIFQKEEDRETFQTDFNEHLSEWRGRCQELEKIRRQRQAPNVITTGKVRTDDTRIHRIFGRP